MKTVYIVGRKYTAFVDTGSDNTIIKKSSVPVGVVRQQSIKRRQGFGESIVETMECILTTFKKGEYQAYTRIKIVPDTVLRYEVFLSFMPRQADA